MNSPTTHTDSKMPMRLGLRPKPSQEESGIALVIVIIALLLITAVAAGMIILSNSEINVDNNYRDSQVALFAAKAGLQEARDRMLQGNANPITLPTVLPLGAGVYATYLTATGVQPWSSSGTVSTLVGKASVYDSEFLNEMGLGSFPTGFYTNAAINTNYSGPTANPLPYQWVRINQKIDRSAYTSGTPYYVDGQAAHATKQVMYDSTSQSECVAGSASGPCFTNSSTLSPVYEITSFAVTPNGTRRMLQNEVAAVTFNLNLNASLSIPGTVGTFQAGNSANYGINGVDGSGSAAPAVPGCTTNPNNKVLGVGVASTSNITTVDGGIPNKDKNNYPGSCGSNPCVGVTSLPGALSGPGVWNSQTLPLIQQNSNVCIVPSAGAAKNTSCPNPVVKTGSGGTYSWSDITGAMPGGSWTNQTDNPQVIYVDGNLDISAQTGSGILVVTGNLQYDGNSGWNGIILVVGDGTTTYFDVNGGGHGQFNGAIFLATANGSNWGTADFNINGGGGSGIYYNSCWINNAQRPVTYLLLSSKEIE